VVKSYPFFDTSTAAPGIEEHLIAFEKMGPMTWKLPRSSSSSGSGKAALTVAFVFVCALVVCREISFSRMVAVLNVESNPSYGPHWGPFVDTHVSIEKRRRLPHWRVVTDCSSFSLDCMAHARLSDQYSDYPIPPKTIQERETWTVQDLSQPIQEWRETLAGVYQTNRTGISNIYPQKASAHSYEQCMALAGGKKTTTEQLDDVLSNRLQPERDTGMIAFTITDYNYAQDTIHDFVQAFEEVVGFPTESLLIVAIDKATTELACQYGYPVISWTNDESLRDAVANTKIVISSELVRRGMPFFFSEMDVFWIQSPKPSLIDFLNEPAQLIFSPHQNNPWGANIGVYASKANEGTVDYFGHCLDVLKEKPDTHDQYVMVRVLLQLMPLPHPDRITTNYFSFLEDTKHFWMLLPFSLSLFR
jgi:hypothetical protein